MEMKFASTIWRMEDNSYFIAQNKITPYQAMPSTVPILFPHFSSWITPDLLIMLGQS